MKRLVGSWAIVLMLGVGCGLIANAVLIHKQSSEQFGQDLVIEPSEINLQRAKPGAASDSSMTIRLSNRSEKTIFIQKTQATCGCTSLTGFLAGELRPGETKQVRTTLSIPAIGRRDAQIIFHAVGGSHSKYTIPVHLAGEERNAPYITHVPEQVDIRGRTVGSTVPQVMEFTTIENRSSSSWIKRLESSSADIEVSAIDVVNVTGLGATTEQRTYRVTLLATIPDPKQDLNAWLTSNERMGSDPAIRSLVRVKCVSPILVIPAAVSLDLSSEGSRLVTLVSQFNESFSATAECDADSIQVIPETSGERTTHIFRVVASHEATATSRASIRFSVSLDDRQSWTLPVVFASQ